MLVPLILQSLAESTVMMYKTTVTLLLSVLALSSAVPHLPRVPIKAEEIANMPREQAVAHLKELLREPLEAGVLAAVHASIDTPATRGVIDNQIIAMLEKLRVVMREGSESMGVPVLDPFHLSHVEVATHQNLIDLDGSLDEFVIEGLSDFVIDKMKWSTILLKLTFALTMPEIKVTGVYDIDSLLAHLLPIYGAGPFEIAIRDFAVTGTAKIGMKGVSFYVKSIELDYTLGEYHSEFSGLLGGGDLSDLLNEVINDLVPEIIEANEDIVTDALADVLVVVANKVLDGIL